MQSIYYLHFHDLNVMAVAAVCCLDVSLIIFILDPTKYFTSELFCHLPTSSLMMYYFCCAVVLVDAFINLRLHGVSRDQTDRPCPVIMSKQTAARTMRKCEHRSGCCRRESNPDWSSDRTAAGGHARLVPCSRLSTASSLTRASPFGMDRYPSHEGRGTW